MPHHKKAVSSQQSVMNLKDGFTLIEVLLTLLFSTILVVLLLTAASTLLQTYKTNQQSLAARIATKEIETLRQTSYDSISGGSFSDPDLSKLTSSSGNLTVSNYQSSADVKQITVTVSWVQNGTPKQVILETLIYKNGI